MKVYRRINMSVKGYKGFDKRLQCQKFQYEVGRVYEMEGLPKVCERGFHFCERFTDVHDYYKLENSRVCEIEALGDIGKEDGKSATNRIKIIRELSREEICTLANIGNRNTGCWNTGDRNSGNWNTGNCNSGYFNRGDNNAGDSNSDDNNSGNRNSGRWNSGNRNSGDNNVGDSNSGNRNSGSYNSGEFNSCNYSAGIFMSRRISYGAFNKSLTEAEFNELLCSEGYRICQSFTLVKFRIRTKTGIFGDFRYMSYKASWKVFWNGLSFSRRMAVRRMPFLDKDVFFEITGVRL
jgi:hypothetical protein